jgi:hypothetical protein
MRMIRRMERMDHAGPIDLDHVRRARRVLQLLVERFGVVHFMESAERRDTKRKVSKSAVEDAVALARSWIERRTGRPVTEEVLQLMRKDLRTLLVRRISEGAACVR